MKTTLAVLALAILALAPASASEVTGQYVEARTCDVWTGPCFANAEISLDGKHAVMAWKIEQGTRENVKLDGLGIVAVVQASNTLGTKQTGKAKSLLIVDQKADAAQQQALIEFAREQAGKLLSNVGSVQRAEIDLVNCECEGNVCATLKAGGARIETRCLHAQHDRICGNESAYYPPLVKNLKVKAAMAVEHTFAGKGLGQTWQDRSRRGAYVGTFTVK